jgi:hypothetical protein
MVLVARLLPGLNTLLHTLSLRTADTGVVGVIGVAGVPGLAGIDIDLWYLLPSPSTSNTWTFKGLVEIFLSLPRPRSG